MDDRIRGMTGRSLRFRSGCRSSSESTCISREMQPHQMIRHGRINFNCFLSISISFSRHLSLPLHPITVFDSLSLRFSKFPLFSLSFCFPLLMSAQTFREIPASLSNRRIERTVHGQPVTVVTRYRN